VMLLIAMDLLNPDSENWAQPYKNKGIPLL
jgi:hypothetical protein